MWSSPSMPVGRRVDEEVGATDMASSSGDGPGAEALRTPNPSRSYIRGSPNGSRKPATGPGSGGNKSFLPPTILTFATFAKQMPSRTSAYILKLVKFATH